MSERLKLSGGGVFLLSALYFFGGTELLFPLLLAAAAHELGHLAAISLVKGRITELSFDITGFCIGFSGLEGRSEKLFAVLAGPAGGFALAYLFSELGNRTGSELMLSAAAFSLTLSLFNLLPILPLDGGCALFYLLEGLLSRRRAERTAELSGFALSVLLIAAGLYMLGKSFAPALLISGMLLLWAQRGIVNYLSLL